jgi:hypothetical protein
MDQVFLLWHVQALDDGTDDEKLIGVYRSDADAKAGIERVRHKSGFAALPDGFQICPYELDRDNWTEGFVVSGD